MHMTAQKTIRGISFITWVGLIINVLLSVFKIIAGIVGHSYAVLADGFHSLSDLITDIALLIGVRYWTARPDECHPYGHERLEQFIAFLIAVILALTALGIVYSSLTNFLAGETQKTTKIAFIAAFCSIIIKEALYHWTILKGRKFNSSALVASAWHHRSDALSSIPAAIAAAITTLFPSLIIADLIGAIIVAIFIIWAAWKIASPAVNILIDGGAGRETREAIINTAKQVEGVKSVHALRTRFLGQGVDVNMHVMVDGNITVKAGHTIAHAVEDALYKIGPEISSVTIHIEPCLPLPG